VAVAGAGRITEFAIRGYGAQPSGTPIRFRVIRPRADGKWVPVLTSKFVTLPPQDGVHRFPTAELDPNGPDAFPVQAGDAIGVFQNADAPGHSPGDPTPWTIFSSQDGAEMYEVSIHDGFNNGDAESPSAVDGLELLLQATVQPVVCADSSKPYEGCAAKLAVNTRATGPARVGKPLTLVDEVKSLGPAAALGVILTHGFPAGVTLGPLPAGCTQTTKAPPVVRCDVGRLGFASETRREITFTMTPKKKGPIVNTARAFSPTPNPDPSQATDAFGQKAF
jgi:hypothetical protein